MAAQSPHVQKSRNELSLKTLARIELKQRVGHDQQAPQPRCFVAEGVTGQQVERNHQQHDATEGQRNRRLLPGNRPLAADQPMSRNNPQGMKRMIDRANQAVLPVSSIDLLCLADVPQPVGKTGLGVPEPPGHETGRHRHQETNPDCVLKRRHDGPSYR